VTERLADFGIFQSAFRCPAAVTYRARRIEDATERNTIKRRFESVIQFSDQLPWLEENIIETEFRFVASDTTE